jgi:hypothetical protein
MVGFVKQLVHEQAATDVPRARDASPPGVSSKFESVLVTPSIVRVTNARATVGASA